VFKAACAMLALAASTLTIAAGASAEPNPYKQGERACVSRGGAFGVYEGGGGYYCNFGGLPPASHGNQSTFGPSYQKACENYGGWVYEEYPPPYSYACYIADAPSP
jgi:hypothetical protein